MSMAKDNKEALMGKEHELGTADRDFFWGCNGRLTQPRSRMAYRRRAARPVVTTEAVRATATLRAAARDGGRNGRLLLINLLPRDERDHPSVH